VRAETSEGAGCSISAGRESVYSDPFIPDRLTLMDHRVTQKDGPHFIYLLPYSTTEALIENTYFFPAHYIVTPFA
jgi:hypothetical protein